MHAGETTGFGEGHLGDHLSRRQLVAEAIARGGIAPDQAIDRRNLEVGTGVAVLVAGGEAHHLPPGTADAQVDFADRVGGALGAPEMHEVARLGVAAPDQGARRLKLRAMRMTGSLAGVVTAEALVGAVPESSM